MKKKEKSLKKQTLTQETAKNSFYNMFSTIISRIGGLILTVILARFLLPELFGIYSLVLSIIAIALTFTNLGISTTLTRYVSEELGKKNKPKATRYIKYLFKFRIILSFFIIFLIIIFNKFISNVIFQKPEVYFPLLFACFYLLMEVLFGFFKSLFSALKDFRAITILQFVSQTSRIIFVLIAVLLISPGHVVSGIFVSLGIGFLITCLIAFLIIDKKILFNKKSKKEKINQKRILSYLGFVSIVSVSLTFFGSIDKLMLGRFVSSEYLGFYQAALSLVTSAAALLGFGGVLLPVFTQIHKKRLQRGFHKAFKYIVLLAIPGVFGLILVSRYFILAIYGKEYLTASIPLYALSLMILINPLIAFYSSLFEAKEKPKLLAKLVSTSLIINIALNYILIKYLLQFGQEYAILGAALATVLSRGFYLIALIVKTNKIEKLNTRFKEFFKPLIASAVMALFLVSFPKIVDMNWIFGIIEIVIGILIYFSTLYFLKGFEKTDIKVFKAIFTNKLKNIIKNKKL